MKGRLIVDSKMRDLSTFSRDGQKTWAAKLNAQEYRELLLSGDPAPESHFEYMVVTAGDLGGQILMHRYGGENRSCTHRMTFKAHPVQAVDVCGCGDTFIAGMAVSLLQTVDYMTAVQFASAAAATVVIQHRTAVADLSETVELLGRKV